MKKRERKHLTGRITLVQEERFRMVDDVGRSYLFDLSHRASASAADLSDWMSAKARLVAEYEGEPETETAIVRKIREA